MTRSLHLTGAISAALVLAVCGSADAQWLKTPTPGIPRTADGKPNLTAPAPKTHDGKPDLSGIWRIDPGGYDLNIASDLKPGDVLPWAETLFKQRSEEFSKDHPAYRCMPEVGPLYNFGMFKVLQTTGTMAVLSQSGVYRQILTDGRSLPVDPHPTWMGYSVGRWDGDTLVIESAGFNDRTWLDFGGHPHTEALRTTERYRRKDFGHMQVQITFEDTKAYTRPWTITLAAELVPDTELLETVCNENEKSLQHFVVTDEDRRKSRTVVTIAPAILSSYAGTYEMKGPPGELVTFTVSVENGRLVAAPSTGGRFLLTAESETTFSASGAPVVFHKDASGAVSDFTVHTVEGDQVFVRKR
ncbi:MAG TPA: hypothetical protein VI485_00765 [Vicinamibacterales bacterium]|nr:hypothetical protein [Vicinamibacterales bacterium]